MQHVITFILQIYPRFPYPPSHTKHIQTIKSPILEQFNYPPVHPMILYMDHGCWIINKHQPTKPYLNVIEAINKLNMLTCKSNLLYLSLQQPSFSISYT